ncbi:unnamed protein product [Prorocentrum cordatum]|uniref:Uncharacterized protein n=1 Tax=Prorocentrum cordatum TaxID=2364126 RepID=A0ABN9T8N6_9DINO|nr:unnamed protein product [Polarella glacialis]
MEYQAHDGRCLLWWYPVQSMEPRPGHTCALVRSRNGSGVTVTASALTPEEPRAATHGGLSEREEALVGSVVGSIVGVAVGAAGARAHAAAAGLSTGLTDALEKDLRSTLTTTTAALVRLNATEAKAAASNPSRDMLTVIPSAGESVGSILRPSDTSNGTASGTAAASNTRNGTASGTAVASNTSNGTASGTAVAATTSNGTASLTAAASNTSNGTASGTAVAARSEAADQDPGTWRWAAMGAALCGCAACALGVAAVRAARPRATRAADLELKEEDEENSDDDAHLSDDLEAALAAAAAGPAGAGAPTQHRAAPLPRLLGPALRPPCGLLKRPAAPASPSPGRRSTPRRACCTSPSPCRLGRRCTGRPRSGAARHASGRRRCESAGAAAGVRR